jgi:acetyl esterase
MGHDSINRNGEGYLLTKKSMEYFRGHYLPKKEDWSDWRASPLLAKSLAGLPPALVLTAGFDPLVDEGKEYAERMSKAGVTSSTGTTPDMVHGFITMGRGAGHDECGARRLRRR